MGSHRENRLSYQPTGPDITDELEVLINMANTANGGRSKNADS
jgi:hypothetical protein